MRFIYILITVFSIIFIYTEYYSLEVSEKYIKDLIDKNKSTFNKILIDEKNNYIYFYNNTRNPLYHMKTSRKINYKNSLLQNTTSNILYDNIQPLFFYLNNIFLFIFFYFGIKFFIEQKKIKEEFFNVNKYIDVDFDDIIGLNEIKQDLKQYIDMIQNRDKYINCGAKIPKGLLFTGPPGTGKTLLAKAIAGEAETSFINISGSDFIEKYVGVGAKRITKLFELARENSPCIIFIDEIDSIGKKRNSYDAEGQEYSQTINKLLCEMDGFNENDNILIIAATNMKQILDPALTRSGRFDRNIVFDIPNIDERKKLFKLYLNKIKISKDIQKNFNKTCSKLAKITSGLSGADIANVVNQSIIIHLKNNKETGTTFKNLEQAIEEILVGVKKKERLMTKEEKNIVAHHEAGHALVAYLLKNTTPPIKVSIIPRGEAALGYAQQELNDKKLYSKDELYDKMCVLLGGRIAEEIMFDKITTGAYDDIEKLTKLSLDIVSKYGMSEIGIINYDFNDTYISDTIKLQIDTEMRLLIKKMYDITKELLLKNKNELIKIANHLLKKEVLLKDEIKNLIEK